LLLRANYFMVPTSIAIRSSYSHHSQNAGYKQILKYTRPLAIFGLDESSNEVPKPYRNKYMWLFEWDALQIQKRQQAQLLHILYAEEYYRFAWRWFKCPIVATFHQPPDLLEVEISAGNSMGKVAGFTHSINKKRFEKLAATIVTTAEQKEVLKKVINPDKIHVIPLGVDIATISNHYENTSGQPLNHQIITVGNWKRDWDFYFDYVKHCQTHKPNYSFVLINRKFTDVQLNTIKSLHNINYITNADDATLYKYLKESWVQFLPFSGAAGNNSLNEGLALGCPVVTNVTPQFLTNTDAYIKNSALNFEGITNAMEYYFEMNLAQRLEIATIARNAVMVLDWKTTAEKTIEIYKSII